MTLLKLGTDNLDQETLDVLENLLLWRKQFSDKDIAPLMQNLLKKLQNASSLLLDVQKLRDELFRLNSEKVKMTDELFALNAKFSTERNVKAEIEQKLLLKKRWFDDLAKKKKELDGLPLEKERYEKENADLIKEIASTREKYKATSQLVKNIHDKHWLDPNVKAAILNVWLSLPKDDLDKSLENKA